MVEMKGRLDLSKYSSAPFGEQKGTTARKEHACTSCGGKIDAAEVYFSEEQFLKNLSRPIVKVCMTCHKEGRFDLRFPEQEKKEGMSRGPLDCCF